MPDKRVLAVDEPLDSSKTSKQKRTGMRRSSSLRRSTELEDSSSGDEGDKDLSEVCYFDQSLFVF